MKVKRYTWEDTLIEAESLSILPSGAVNMCLRLARAINWEPKDGGPSELRWKNEDALKSVNSSRATYFRYRSILMQTGFLTEKGGNLLPLVPDLSQIETTESHIETDLSQIETEESHIDNPYSEDIYTDNEYSEDSLSVEDAPVVAAAPTASSNNEIKEEEGFLGSLNSEDFEGFPNYQENPSLDSSANSTNEAVLNPLEDSPESQSETPEEVSEEVAQEGQKFLLSLLRRNGITRPADVMKANERYWDTEYESEIPLGVKRAGWIVTNLKKVAA